MQKKDRVLLIVGVLVLVCVAGLGIYFYTRNNTILTQNTDFPSRADVFVEDSSSILSPTPFPFEDLTIPYLANRGYNSTLGSRQLLSEQGNYTSYLTSYMSDGLKINGLLNIPNGEEPSGGWPAIVFIHGYIPPAQYRTTQNYYDYVDYLSRNGFVVFKIDLRGHDESEGEPGGAYYSSDYIIDALNAYSAMQNSDYVNPEKIGLWGHSMAGNVLFRSFAAKKDIPAIVIWAGAVYSYDDFGKYGIDDGSYRPPTNDTERQRRRKELFDTYGEFSSNHPFWRQVPGTNYLDQITGAIQVHHAVNDSVVDIGFSRDLISLLDKTTIPHELFEYESGGHNLSGASFTQAMQRTVAFFKKYL